MRYEIISAIKEIYTFSAAARPSVVRVRVPPKREIGDDFSILSASRLPRCLPAARPCKYSADIKPPPRYFFLSFLPPRARRGPRAA